MRDPKEEVIYTPHPEENADSRAVEGGVTCLAIAALIVILLVLAATGDPNTPAGVIYGQMLW